MTGTTCIRPGDRVTYPRDESSQGFRITKRRRGFVTFVSDCGRFAKVRGYRNRVVDVRTEDLEVKSCRR